MTNERIVSKNMVSITSNTNSTHLIMDSNNDWTQCRDEVPSITSSQACDKSIQTESLFLAGKSGQVPCTCLPHSGYFQWGLYEVFMIMCRITIHEPHQIHERSIGLIRILHQKGRVLRMASQSSLNRIYFENHPGA